MSDAMLPERRCFAVGAGETKRRALLLVAAWSVLGFLVRIAAARGDLWLDEIWNIRLVARTTSAWDILFALPYDSNHPLNSLWLALVGPDASPIAARFASILEGTATIPLVAALAGRWQPRDAWLAAAFVALSPLFVQFGSEARGYAALMLAAPAALLSLEVWLDRRAAWRPLVPLALAVAFGTFAHPTMLVISALLLATAGIRLARGEGMSRAALGRLAGVGVALVVGTMPAGIAWFVSLTRMPAHFGGMTPWSSTSFVLGLGRLTEATFGLPLMDSFALPATLAGAAIALAGLLLVPVQRRVFPALAILALPALQALLHIPNEEYARFHLVTGLALALLAIDATLSALQRSGVVRTGAIVFAALVFLGQASDLVRFLAIGRGSPGAVVAAIHDEGPADVAVEQNWIVRETKLVIDWAAARRKIEIDVQPLACPGRTAWLIRVDQPGGEAPAPAEIATPDGCATQYRLRMSQRAYGLSGFTWHLYRRVGDPAAP